MDAATPSASQRPLTAPCPPLCSTVGFEVMPSNVAYTANALKLSFREWDSSQPSPQAPAYKKWLKANLVQGYPIVWFPICKGDSHECYPESCPNGGSCDHVEPMLGALHAVRSSL